MRSKRLWIGVTCGVALALSVVAAVDAGIQTAGAAGEQQLWARVGPDGALITPSNSSITSVRTAGAPRGDYVVDFNTNIPASCSWTATPYLDAASAAGGPTSAKALAAVAVRVAGDNESIRVWVFEIAAAPKQADSFVTVQVLC